MSLPVLLLLSLLTVQRGGSDTGLEGAKNIKATIDSNPTGFRTVFPKDYYVVHHYTRSMLCDKPCCVFPAAVVLRHSWDTLRTNLWDEHINYSLITDIRDILHKIIIKHKNSEMLQENTALEEFSTVSSSPEDLLNFTSELFSRWIEVGVSPTIETCTLPTFPPFERKDYGPSRARLLTTRAISEEEGLLDKMIDSTQLPSNGVPPSLTYYTYVWSPLLLRLYLWLLP